MILMHRLVTDDRLVDIAAQFLGANVAMFAAHYIAKKPSPGQAVQWHQDGSYWPLEPMEVTTLWVAGTDSTVANGCMQVLPGTHTKRLLKRREMVDLDTDKYVLSVGIHPDQIDEADVLVEGGAARHIAFPGEGAVGLGSIHKEEIGSELNRTTGRKLLRLEARPALAAWRNRSGRW